MRALVKRWWRTAALLLVFFFCTLWALQNAAALGREYPGTSLRYNTAIPYADAHAARTKAAGLAGEEQNALWPTFWNEQAVKAEAEWNTAEASAIFYEGDPHLALDADYLSGGAPAELDSYGCAVSNTLAWQLWGGTDVTDAEIKLDGTTYTVRGVFKSSEYLLLAGGGSGEIVKGWQGVELTGGKGIDPRTEASDFAQSIGLGTPDAIVDGGAFTRLARAAAFLPAFVLLAAGLLRLWRLRPARKGWRREVPFFLLLLLLAALLPTLLNLLPPRFIPTRWSDFSHFTTLAGSMMAELREYLALVPALRDVEARLYLLKGAACVIVGLFCAPGLCRRLLPAKKEANVPGLYIQEIKKAPPKALPQTGESTA